MVLTRLDDGQMQGLGGHLQSHVVAVIAHAAGLGQSHGTDDGSAVVFAVSGFFVLQGFDGGFAAHDFGGSDDRVHDRHVAGAAADVVVLLEPLADLFTAGIGILFQQGVSGHDEAGAAETALNAAEAGPGQLQRMGIVGRADALDSGDLGIVLDVLHLLDAGADQLAVEDDGAGAAQTDVAADLGAGEAYPAQDFSQRILFRIAENETFGAVDGQSNSSDVHVLSSLKNNISIANIIRSGAAQR